MDIQPDNKAAEDLNFHSFQLHDDLLAGIEAMNFRKPTPIQQAAIPVILKQHDLIACAQTGTGKTAAYVLPLLDKISHARHDHTSTLVLVPTRELAKQIDDQIAGFAYFVSATSIAIYGGNKGESWDQQKNAITSGADIIIATPGRLIAHMNMGYVKFDKLDYLVLDEADKMLDMGFMPDLLRIVSQLPANRQTLMFSATMPPKIRELARKILKEPTEINLAISKPAEGIDQRMYLTYDKQKPKLIEHLLKDITVQSMIVFTSRKSAVNDIVRILQKMGHKAEGITSDRTQDEREATLQGFRNKQFQILVATDIMSRGIDIDNISHILNYDVPQDAEDYIHRIGRTARASTTGTAITFINEKDQVRVKRIERLIEREIPKLENPEEVGPGPAFEPNKHREDDRTRSKSRKKTVRKPGGTETRPAASTVSKERKPRRTQPKANAENNPDRPKEPYKPKQRFNKERGANAAEQSSSSETSQPVTSND
ncbi:DEAD/DEAH box helicase [Adhaeribacter pallidiroseus]|uniref:RNA helicase n=1 Tax=Adhaeribacter pallidiroseus TaxID=2072847 RepID=A0A369QEL8_9BACT|nr:RNA helicase [Adhaeribacter pallidiroseus]